jgi:Papain family cysteine protease
VAIVVSPKGHRYDRTKPPQLPPQRMIRRWTPGLALVVDLRASCGPIKDQGAEGACTAHAGTSANEWIHRRYLNTKPVFSPQYTYAKELIAQGNFPNDEGSNGETMAETMIVNGCCELSLYPYVAGQILEPTPAQDTDAAQFRLGAYHGLANSAVAQSVLADPTPWPIEIGFDVFSSFESDQTAQTGIMTVPAASEELLGGHEVLIVGMDLAPSPTLRPATCPPAFLVQNSWGTGWGLSGFFWMPVPILDAADTDLKIVHSGAPWK